jgi:hypothetical protein
MGTSSLISRSEREKQEFVIFLDRALKNMGGPQFESEVGSYVPLLTSEHVKSEFLEMYQEVVGDAPEDTIMDHITEVMNRLEDVFLDIDGVTEKLFDEIKKVFNGAFVEFANEFWQRKEGEYTRPEASVHELVRPVTSITSKRR